jgi:enoyl-CoA hydratase/carnithine racemase
MPKRSTMSPVLAPPATANDHPKLVRVEQKGPTAIITIDNPPVNILATPVLDAIADAVVRLTEDPSVRCLILTGAGEKAFTAGANIKEMVAMGREAASLHSMKGQAVANLLERSPLPVIAAVQGFCLGGGCELSLACDFIVAADNAVFGQPEINIGVIPGWGGSRRLTRAIGVARARRWILTGEQFSAQQAMADGLVDRVVPKARLMEEALKLAELLASKGSVALAASKYAVNQASDATRMLGLEYERELWGMLFETEDQKEGMRAFLEKRTAQFRDRADWERRTSHFPWEAQGNVFDTSKALAKIDARETPQHPPRGDGRANLMAMAEAYRDLGQQTMEALFSLSWNAARNYQRWAQDMVKRTPASMIPSTRRESAKVS